MSIWIKQVLLALWAFVLLCLAFEWLLPGSVSSLFPIFGGMFVVFLVTLIGAEIGSKRQKVWTARLLGSLALAGGIGVLVVFAQRQGSSLVDYSVLVCFIVCVGAAVALFLPER